jgi:hypothetical protein
MNAWHMRKLNEPICCTISYRQGAKCPLGFDEIEIGEHQNATSERPERHWLSREIVEIERQR